MRTKVGVIGGIGDCLYVDTEEEDTSPVHPHSSLYQTNTFKEVNYNYKRDFTTRNSATYIKKPSYYQRYDDYKPLRRENKINIIQPRFEKDNHERCSYHKPQEQHGNTHSIYDQSRSDQRSYYNDNQSYPMSSDSTAFMWGECFQRFSKVYDNYLLLLLLLQLSLCLELKIFGKSTQLIGKHSRKDIR